MKVTVDVRGQQQVVQRIRDFTPRLQARIMQTVQRLTIGLQRVVMDEKLSGQVLNVRSGRLRRSIGQTVERDNGTVTGIVSTAVVYAPIHEYGGVIHRVSKPGVVRLRTDTKGNLLRQELNGQPSHLAVFARKSHKRAREVAYEGGKSYTIKIPERSFLRSALRDQRSTILQDIRSATSDAAK
ncbi:HK97 gp10 family phage protein [Paraburkholderia caballeronis]|uniref:HK97 gp10 family phage protein n=1 Tax=Paraburkholderia caballeronis TaxID=416943 RepID=UPI00106694EC|nr:HK97 gp10 family phage protein [Paraburkholderia caballeronis]TDV04683.1 hypothetical protein C7408_13145 [Paraburkholderia caballeronis]TDV07926.1 hypothetical protein C7406_13345 [Paraburkholderia caballeronis]TDV18217.1 hypothetical protein C7404_13145 [Paraburkholderia caballeronis]